MKGFFMSITSGNVNSNLAGIFSNGGNNLTAANKRTLYDTLFERQVIKNDPAVQDWKFYENENDRGEIYRSIDSVSDGVTGGDEYSELWWSNGSLIQTENDLDNDGTYDLVMYDSKGR